MRRVTKPEQSRTPQSSCSGDCPEATNQLQEVPEHLMIHTAPLELPLRALTSEQHSQRRGFNLRSPCQQTPGYPSSPFQKEAVDTQESPNQLISPKGAKPTINEGRAHAPREQTLTDADVRHQWPFKPKAGQLSRGSSTPPRSLKGFGGISYS